MNPSCVNIMALPTHPLSGRAPTGGAIRREATKAASEISFKFAFQFIVTEMIVLGNTASPGTIPKRLEHLRGLWKWCS